jgi:hypothetical protein
LDCMAKVLLKLHSQIADVKAKIKDAQGFAVESQKIIYAGKILPDASSVGQHNIKEKDFLVVMVTKVSRRANHPYVANA